MKYFFCFCLIVLGGAYYAGKNHYVLINTTPSVPQGIYIRSFFLDKSVYVAFTSPIPIRDKKKLLLIKKWRYWNSNFLYVYGTHPKSISSKHIGYINKKKVVPMNLLFSFVRR